MSKGLQIGDVDTVARYLLDGKMKINQIGDGNDEN